MQFYNTLTPYATLQHPTIQYTNCRDFSHISRCKGLRQVVHNSNTSERLVTLETPNVFTATNIDVIYYDVPSQEENRLDLIAYKFLGAASYSWVISYFNQIEDGFTVREGQRLRIPTNISSLFKPQELLASISALQLNLGSE